ncbi:hypothetical protein N7509_012658 [Penicillium cosmopolitanum]|uniref:Uncharacterized protein n=1 Tax=Penicillium cosmopolitanum TaxID=1131564 RepID=A0A9W9VG60_9EURO|nr:uncharacterized protein N7509_012658 [Penicillium cosmopolitanum]KAJ5379539.1 hypothetical protein N7509_012658 [Penicillium cosmopolitanum]
MAETEIYTDEDLTNLNSLDLAALWTELHQRLKPETHRLTHGEFCAFRGALIRNPILAAAADLDEDYPGLFQKVQYYLKNPLSKDYLCRAAGSFPDHATVLQRASTLNSDVEYNNDKNSKSNKDNDPEATVTEPDLVTGAIIADCEYCVTWLYELSIIKSGHVGYNEHGWSLLGVAVKADARKVIEVLINHSGDEPGPIQPYRIWSDGREASSILKYAVSAHYPNLGHDNCFWALLEWCDSFMEEDDSRVKAELDPLDQYKISQLGSVRVANLLKTFAVDLSQTASGPQGEGIWHAAAVHQNTVFLTWLNQVYRSGISDLDDQGRTPLVYAIRRGKLQAVEWFLQELRPHEIVLKGDSPGQLIPSPLDNAIEALNVHCVAILRCVYTHNTYEHLSNDTNAIIENINRLITSSDAQKRKIETRFRNGMLTDGQRRILWRIARECAGEKCQVLLEGAPSIIFYNVAFRKCLETAKKCDVGFLQYYLTDDRTKKGLRSGGGLLLP